MLEVLNAVMRWVHIASVVSLIGGTVYARAVMWPAILALSPEARAGFEAATAERFKGLVRAAIVGLLISGLYNVVSSPGHSMLYHALLGVKLVLVMHVFAVAVLITRPKNERRGRMMLGCAISGLVIIGISAYLRHIF